MPDVNLPPNPELLSLLSSATEEILSLMVTENFTHLRSIENEPETDEDLDPNQAHELRFSGEVNGRIVLRSTREGGVNLAGEMLMVDDESISSQDVADAMCECANMICGAFKLRLGCTDDDFVLSVPGPLQSPAPRPLESGGALLYRLRRGVVTIEVWRDGDPAP